MMNSELPPRPSRTLPPVPRAEPGKSVILFCSQHFRRSGIFYENKRNDPDYETLAADGGARLYLADPTAVATHPLALTSGREDCRSSAWSPDGGHIAFDAAPCGKFDPDLSDGYHMGQRHIYVMDAIADARGDRQRRRLTHDKGDHSAPSWSPDGRYLLFQRQPDDRDSNLLFCVVRTGSSEGRAAPGTLTPVTNEWNDGSATAAWSPDSRWIAVQIGNALNDKSYLRLYRADRLDGTTPPAREIPGVLQFAWSPNGALLYLYRSDETGQILDVATGKTRRVAAVLNPIWLADGNIIGDRVRGGRGGSDEFRQVVLSAANGSVQRRIIRQGKSLDRFPRRGDDATMGLLTSRRWYPVPQRPQRYVVTTSEGHSDGLYGMCYLVDARRGTYHTLRSGHFFGFSPDGRRFLRADYQWVGPYKRGGCRVGALECVGTLDGQSVAMLTDRLSVLSDAAWH